MSVYIGSGGYQCVARMGSADACSLCLPEGDGILAGDNIPGIEHEMNPAPAGAAETVSKNGTLIFQFWDTKAGFCRKKSVGRRKMSMGRRIWSVGRRVGFMGRHQMSMGRRVGSVGRRVRLVGRRVLSHFETPHDVTLSPQKPGEGPQRRQEMPHTRRLTPQKLTRPPCCLSASS